MDKPEPQAFTVDAFCDAYGIRRNLAYDEMKAGRLVYRKAGAKMRKTLILKADADAWLHSLPIGNPSTDAVATTDSPSHNIGLEGQYQPVRRSAAG